VLLRDKDTTPRKKKKKKKTEKRQPSPKSIFTMFRSSGQDMGGANERDSPLKRRAIHY
jgi:hypothetical protein